MRIKVSTQAEFDAAWSAHKDDSRAVIEIAYGSARVVAYGSARVVAYGSARVVAYGSARVVAYGSARVVAYGSARVVAYGSASVVAYGSARVVAYGSARVLAYGSARVVAYGSARVEAYGAVQVRAFARAVVAALCASVVVSVHAATCTVTGCGVVVVVAPVLTAEAWCAYHGVPVVDGVATVAKGVRADGRSQRGTSYLPGETPEAADWDGGKAECGGGLHFSPRPSMTLRFDVEAVRFMLCRVALADMQAPQATDKNPEKIKARRVLSIVECDRDGVPLEAPHA